MILQPKQCKRNRKILCGVVKNLGNCPFPTDEQCKENNSTMWLGVVNNRFGTLVLKLYRFNHHKIKISVLDKNMCECCRTIWVEEINCPICKGDD